MCPKGGASDNKQRGCVLKAEHLIINKKGVFKGGAFDNKQGGDVLQRRNI